MSRDKSPNIRHSTVISSPQPLAMSTAKKPQIRINQESAITSDDSLGLLSLKSFDVNSELTVNSKRQDKEGRQSLSALPSCFFKPAKKEKTEFSLNRTGSTISESDLFEMSTSTPRASLGLTMAQLAQNVQNPDTSLEAFMNEISKTMSLDARKRLSEDEKQFVLSRKNVEFSFDRENSLPFNSIGEFFQEKSDNISDFLSRSPRSQSEPVPLYDQSNESLGDSLSASKIYKLLANTENDTAKLTDYLLNHRKNDSSIERKSQNFPNLEASQANPNFRSVPNSTRIDEHVLDSIDQNSLSDYLNTRLKLDVNSFNGLQKSTNKENVINDKSLASIRSVSSLSSLPDGKLPIESTKNEIIWACTKIGKTVTTEFTIRNRSTNRIRIVLTVSNPAYKLFDRGTAKLLFHPNETKTVKVSFSPLYPGPAVDKIKFLSADLQQTKRQTCAMYGFGGYANVEILQLTKDTTNKYWLCLGSLSGTDKSVDFLVQNTGTVPAFVHINFSSKNFYQFNNLVIVPNKLILSPKEKRKITVSLCPSKEDCRYFQDIKRAIFEMGVLKIVSGPEIVRQRIKRLHKIVIEKKLEVNSICEMICADFPKETNADIVHFKESIGAMKDLLQQLSLDEVILTLEVDLEATVTQQFDESSFFHTLSQETTVFENANVLVTIEPKSVLLTPPVKIEDYIFLQSCCARPLHFEVNCQPEGLMFSPKSGTLKPEQNFLMSVKCERMENRDYKIDVFVDYQVFSVDIKVRIVEKFKKSF